MDYYSLDLQITKEPEGPTNHYTASILENGDIKATQNFELRRDLKLIQMLKDIGEKVLIAYPQPKVTTHIEFGKMLYNTVFSGELGDYLDRQISETQKENFELRLSLQLSEDIPEIAALPWEYLHNGEEFLFIKRNILLSRLTIGVEKTELEPLDSILRMLVIISGPDDPRISPLNTEKEQEIILNALDKLYKEQKIKIDFTEDATLENIQSYLNEQNYHIVHFTGHGINYKGKSYLVFETEDRNAKLIDNKTLVDLFSKRGIRLVVLSSCESAKGSNKEAFGDLASMLSRNGISAVVAMQYSINDDVATQFALNFYETIASGKTVDFALEKARIMMMKSEKSNGLDFATPVLYLSDFNCVRVNEITPEPSEFKNKSMMLTDLQVMNEGFVARKKELRILEKDFMLDVKRVAIIHGLGGMGKTVLATRLALKMNEYFDGIFGIRCASTTTPYEILNNINSFLMMKGVFEFNQVLTKHVTPNHQISLEEKISKLVDILNQKRFLIIFDNFEDCLDKNRKDIENSELKSFIECLLNNTVFNTKFIITTRYDFDLLENTLPEIIEHISLPELKFPQTIWLMNNYRELADLSVTKKKNIYNFIGGHPWAIGRFANLASFQDVDSLMHDLKPLRNESIEFTLLENSLSILDPLAKKLLFYASVFEEAVPFEALSWIIGSEEDGSLSVREPLQKLVQCGLISKEQENDRTIYTEHTIVKDFAKNKLEEEGLDKRQLLIRIARYYEALAGQTGNIWTSLKARKYYFQAEDWENSGKILSNNIDNLILCGYTELAMNLLNESINTTTGNTKRLSEYSLARIYYLLGDLNSAFNMYNNIKSKCEAEGEQGFANALFYSIGMIYQDRGNYEEATKIYIQSLRTFEELGDKRGAAATLHQLGMIDHDQGNYEEAIKKFNQSLKNKEEFWDKSGIAITLHELGNVYQYQGNYEEALKNYDQSLKIREKLGDKNGIALTLGQIASIHEDKGDYEEAAKKYIQSMKLFEELGDKRGIATGLQQLGIIHQEQGNYEEAAKKYNQSLKIREELGDKSGISSILIDLGYIHIQKGNYKEAAQKFDQSLKIGEELGDKRGIAKILHALGVNLQNQGNFKEAAQKFDQSLKIEEELGDKSGIAKTLHALGVILHNQGNFKEAAQKFNQSLKIEEELGDKNGIAESLHSLGNILKDNREYEEAVKKYNQSLELKEQLVDKDGIAETLHQLGTVYYLQGNYEEAVKKYNMSLKIREELGDKSEIAKTLRLLGTIYQAQGNYEEAVKHFNQILEIEEELKDKSGTVATLHQLGMLFLFRNNYKEAAEMYNKALRIEEDIGEKRGIAATLYQLGIIHQDQGNYEEAVKKYNQSLKTFEEFGFKNGIAATLHQLGMILHDLGEYEEALNKHNQSLIIREEQGDKIGIAKTLHQLGMILQDQGEYEEAVKKYNMSLKIEEELGDKRGIAKTQYQLGMICQFQGNYEEAIKKYNQSQKIEEELGDKSGLTKTLHQLGMVYHFQSNYDEAAKNYYKSLKITEELGDKRGIVATLHQLGMLYQFQGNYEEAVAKYNKSLKIKEELGDKRGIAGTLGQLGITHQEHGNYEEAIKIYIRSIKMFEELGDKKEISIMLQLLGTIYQAQGNYEEAVAKYNQLIIVLEEIGNKSKIAEILLQLGSISQKQGNYEEAMEKYKLSFEIFDKLGDLFHVSILFGQIGRLHEEIKNYEFALTAYFNSFEILKELESPYSEILWQDIERIKGKMGLKKGGEKRNGIKYLKTVFNKR